MDVRDRNRQRDLYLKDGPNVVYIPQNWCEEFPVDEQAEEAEIMTYAPSKTFANSEVENLFIPVSILNKLPEVTEAQARYIHPALFEHLDKINRGLV